MPTEEHQNTGYCDLEIFKKILIGRHITALIWLCSRGKIRTFFLLVLYPFHAIWSWFTRIRIRKKITDPKRCLRLSANVFKPSLANVFKLSLCIWSVNPTWTRQWRPSERRWWQGRDLSSRRQVRRWPAQGRLVTHSRGDTNHQGRHLRTSLKQSKCSYDRLIGQIEKKYLILLYIYSY